MSLTIIPFAYFGHNLHTAVTNLHCVSVEKFFYSMRLSKMSVDQSKKNFRNICRYCLAEWWIKPNSIFSYVFGFCCWFLVYLKPTLNLLFFRTSSYLHFALLNISSLDEFFDSLFWMELGICFMAFGGWFDKLWMWRSTTFDFL